MLTALTSAAEAEALYHQTGRLIETMPTFQMSGPLSSDQMKWLGRAEALAQACLDPINLAQWQIAVQDIDTIRRGTSLTTMRLLLYKALALAELHAPPSVRGAFIPAGSEFDAFAALSKLIGSAEQDLLIVDPYLDETILTSYAGMVADGVTLRLLADAANCKPSLGPAAAAYAKQYGRARPLLARLASARSLHDRLLLIDGKAAWVVTQSFKDFAKRSPGEIVRADDTASLKIPHYEGVWSAAQVIV